MLKTLLASPVLVYNFPAEHSIASQSRFSEAETRIIRALTPVIQFRPKLESISYTGIFRENVSIVYNFIYYNGIEDLPEELKEYERQRSYVRFVRFPKEYKIKVTTQFMKSNSTHSYNIDPHKINKYFDRDVMLAGKW